MFTYDISYICIRTKRVESYFFSFFFNALLMPIIISIVDFSLFLFLLVRGERGTFAATRRQDPCSRHASKQASKQA